MKKLSTVLILLINLTFVAQAQIEDEIKSYIDTTEVTVNNGRRLILQKITEKNYSKAKEIYTYLTLQTLSTNYKAFRYSEDIYINMLIGDWNNVSALMVQFYEKSRTIAYPNTYEIFNILYQHVETNINELQEEFNKQHFDDESTQVINAVLYLIKVGNPDNTYYTMIEKYKSQYKKSKYDDFVTHYLPHQSVSAAWAFSFGSGIIVPTYKLSEYYKTNANFNMSMDVNINRIHTSLYFIGSTLPIQKEYVAIVDIDSLTFKKPERFSFFHFGLRGGYCVIKTPRLHLAPHLGIAGTQIESTRFEEEDDEEEGKEEYC